MVIRRIVYYCFNPIIDYSYFFPIHPSMDWFKGNLLQESIDFRVKCDEIWGVPAHFSLKTIHWLEDIGSSDRLWPALTMKLSHHHVLFFFTNSCLVSAELWLSLSDGCMDERRILWVKFSMTMPARALPDEPTPARRCRGVKRQRGMQAHGFQALGAPWWSIYPIAPKKNPKEKGTPYITMYKYIYIRLRVYLFLFFNVLLANIQYASEICWSQSRFWMFFAGDTRSGRWLYPCQGVAGPRPCCNQLNV